jgi:hypothetical protein
MHLKQVHSIYLFFIETPISEFSLQREVMSILQKLENRFVNYMESWKFNTRPHRVLVSYNGFCTIVIETKGQPFLCLCFLEVESKWYSDSIELEYNTENIGSVLYEALFYEKHGEKIKKLFDELFKGLKI